MNPPFHADHVGSLLRPAVVRDARVKRAEGKIGAAELRSIEDEAIKDVIAKQESVGLKSITDGEIRRAAWTTDFLQGLDGVEAVEADAVVFKGATPHRTYIMKVMGGSAIQATR